MATDNNMTSALPDGTLLRSATTTYKIVRTLGQGSFGITYLAEMNNDGTANASTAAVYVTVKEFFMSKINGQTAMLKAFSIITKSASSRRHRT